MKLRFSNSGAWSFLAMLVISAGLLAEDRARTVQYAQSDIVPIQAKVRFSTLIVLPASEEILDFTTGDREFWIINGAHNLCYVHPAEPGIRSNLNLITASGHVYSFLLTEVSKQPGLEPDLKVFVVPKDDPGIAGLSAHERLVRESDAEAYKQEAEAAQAHAARAAQQAQAQAQQEITRYREQYPSKLQFDYTFKEKAARAPFLVSAIYHDDKFTYVKCDAQEKPTIYEIKDGKPDLVNFDFQNGIYIIPKIVESGYPTIGKRKVGFHRRGKES